LDISRNELPRSKLWGILTPIEKFELLTMQFLIFFFSTRFLYICRNGLLIAKLTNGIDEISLRPKLSTPKCLLHRRHPPKYLSGRYNLDRLNNFLRTIRRHRLDQKMNMIIINSNFQKQISYRFDISKHISRSSLSTSSVNTTRRYFAGHTRWYSRTDTLWLL